MLVRIASREDPDQDSLICVCTVCLDYFDMMQLAIYSVRNF